MPSSAAVSILLLTAIITIIFIVIKATLLSAYYIMGSVLSVLQARFPLVFILSSLLVTPTVVLLLSSGGLRAVPRAEQLANGLSEPRAPFTSPEGSWAMLILWPHRPASQPRPSLLVGTPSPVKGPH